MRRIRRRLMRTYANLDIPIEWKDDVVAEWAAKANLNNRRDCRAKTYLDKFRDVAPRARYFPEARWFDSVKSIGYGQFQSCDIVKVLLPDSIESFGDGFEFRQCYNLQDIGDLPRLTAISAKCFYACTSLALKKLPENLTEIKPSAFDSCTSLALENLPSGVAELGPRAFFNCTSLALKKLPENLTEIKSKSFYNCQKLALVQLPDGVTAIGSEAFYNCQGISLSRLPKNLVDIGYWAFRNDTAITIRDIPDGVTAIGSEAFRRCTSLGKIRVLPASPPTAGSHIFTECPMVQLYVPDDSVEAYKAADGWKSYADIIHPLSEWTDE